MTTTVAVGTGELQSKWNALPSTLADDYVLECTGGVGTLDTSASAKTMSGHTVTVKPASGQGFRDSANKLTTDKLAYQTSQGTYCQGTGSAVINIDVAGVILDGMMVKHTTAGYAVQSSSTGTIVRRCVLDAENFGGSFNTVVYGSFAEITNNVIVNRNSDGGAIAITGANTTYIIGNTMIGNPSGSTVSRRGVLSDGGVVVAKDNVVLNFSPAFGAADSGSFDAASDYNATDQSSTGTGTGAHNKTSADGITASSVLKDVSSYANLDAKIKSTASSVIGAGVADATYLTTDIFNTSRLSPPSIGAHDYQAAVVTDAAAFNKFRVAHGVGSQPHYFYGG